MINPISPWVVNGVEIVLTAALGFAATAFWRWRRNAERAAAKAKKANDDLIAAMQAQISAQEGKLLMLGASVQPLTAAMAAMLVKSLTHFHMPRTDLLLSRVGPPNMLTADEEHELRELLRVRSAETAEAILPLERNAADLLPLIIERNRLEGPELSQMQPILVGVPMPHE
jgi:hypothetical protein